ncbi:TerC family protein [Planctomycetales bacterium ZRK34]|nr:TerC family protein [Planctomycetales bacterium ZRK34]
MQIESLWSWSALAALATLTILEIVLGIDNVIFIAILSGKLPQADRTKAQRLGIGAAVGMRILLLLCITWLMGLTKPLMPSAPGFLGELSGKGLILALGGLFLVGKSVYEIHEKLEGPENEHGSTRRAAASVAGVVVQIMLIDIVFSLDSVITAVGMSRQLTVMIAAIVIAGGVMMAFAKPVSGFVENHPTMKVLALAFLILIGVMLLAEAFGQHIPRGYIYFAMAFSLCVELINLRVRKSETKVQLRRERLPAEAD